MEGYNTYVGARYVPIFDGEWDNTKKYEPLVIVVHEGNSYTSRTFVPIGADILDESYWALTGNYNAQVEQYRNEVAEYKEEVSALDTTVSTLSATVSKHEHIFVRQYDTVKDMQNDSNIQIGDYCVTKGYKAIGDGGGDCYFIGDSSKQSSYYTIYFSDYKRFAYRIPQNNANLNQLGGSTNLGFVLILSMYKELFIPSGTYNISKNMSTISNKKLFGESGTIINYSTVTSDNYTFDLKGNVVIKDVELVINKPIHVNSGAKVIFDNVKITSTTEGVVGDISNCEFNNVTFINCSNGINATCDNSTFKNINVANTSADGITGTFTNCHFECLNISTTNDNTLSAISGSFEECRLEDINVTGYDTIIKPTTLKECIIDNVKSLGGCTNGIYCEFTGDGNHGHNNIFENIYIDGNDKGYGIYLKNTTKTSLTNCFMYNHSIALVLSDTVGVNATDFDTSSCELSVECGLDESDVVQEVFFNGLTCSNIPDTSTYNGVVWLRGTCASINFSGCKYGNFTRNYFIESSESANTVTVLDQSVNPAKTNYPEYIIFPALNRRATASNERTPQFAGQIWVHNYYNKVYIAKNTGGSTGTTLEWVDLTP